MQFGKGLFGWVLFISLAVMLFMLLNKQETRYTPISLGEFTRHLDNDRVRFVDIGNDQLYGEFMSPQAAGDRNVPVLEFRVPIPEGATKDWAFTQWLLNNRRGAGLGVRNDGSKVFKDILVPLIPWVLIFGFIWFFVFRQLRKNAEAKAGAPPEAVRVYVVNQPGEPPLATAAPQPPPPLHTPSPGGDN
jgi:cell division protease FtsH